MPQTRLWFCLGAGDALERHTPGMTVPLAVKDDPRLALALALAAAVPMPVGSVVHDRLVTMMGRCWSDPDWSGLGPLAAVDAGLPVGTAVACSAA